MYLPVKLPKDFGFTEEHDMLRKMARRFMDERCPLTEVRRLVDDELGYDPALWKDITELGWTGLVFSESCGGAELDYLSMAMLLEETGRGLLPSPLFASVLAGIAIDLAGTETQKAALLPGIVSGTTIATVALTELENSWEADSVAATATAEGAGYVLSGTKTHVMWASAASIVIAPFRVGDEVALFAVPLPCKGVMVQPEIGVDATRRAARVVFDGATVSGATRLEHGDVAAWRAVLTRGFALLAAETVGAARTIHRQTRDYAIDRVQFLRPIGSFQAVKHPLVNVLLAIEGAWSLAVAAASTLDAAPDRADIPARMAKAAATEALTFAADRGVQLHGGYGFTWDCDAHLFFKRGLWCAATLGDAHHHRRHIADAILGPLAVA